MINTPALGTKQISKVLTIKRLQHLFLEHYLNFWRVVTLGASCGKFTVVGGTD